MRVGTGPVRAPRAAIAGLSILFYVSILVIGVSGQTTANAKKPLAGVAPAQAANSVPTYARDVGAHFAVEMPELPPSPPDRTVRS